MAGNIVPRTDGGSNLGTADKEFNVIYAKSFGGTIASQVVTTNSPTFTGTPAAPTAAAGTDTTQIATTAFANAAASAAASSAVSTHNLANDAHSATIAAAVNTHNVATDAHSTEFAKYLPLSGGAMSGSITISDIFNTDTTNALRLLGDTRGNAYGARGEFCSIRHPIDEYKGAFTLLAVRDNSTYSQLFGTPTGTLTWAGNPVATTNKLSMPSWSCIDFAFVSGSTYTAPSDGWIYVKFTSTFPGGWVYLQRDDSMYANAYATHDAAWEGYVLLPISSGGKVYMASDGANVTVCRFICAMSAT